MPTSVPASIFVPCNLADPSALYRHPPPLVAPSNISITTLHLATIDAAILPITRAELELPIHPPSVNAHSEGPLEQTVRLPSPDGRIAVARQFSPRFAELSGTTPRMLAARELLAYRVSETLGIDLVLPTTILSDDESTVVFIQRNGGVHHIEPELSQRIIEARRVVDATRMPTARRLPPAMPNHFFDQRAAQLHLFDYLLNIRRRGAHASHLIIDSDGKLRSTRHAGTRSNAEEIQASLSDEALTLFFSEPGRRARFSAERLEAVFDQVMQPSQSQAHPPNRLNERIQYTRAKQKFMAQIQEILNRLDAQDARVAQRLALAPSGNFPLNTLNAAALLDNNMPSAYSNTVFSRSTLRRLPSWQTVVHRDFSLTPTGDAPVSQTMQIRYANNERLAYQLSRFLNVDFVPETAILEGHPNQIVTNYLDFSSASQHALAESGVPVFNFILNNLSNPQAAGSNTALDSTGALRSINHAHILIPNNVLTPTQLRILLDRRTQITDAQIAAFFRNPRTFRTVFESDWGQIFDQHVQDLPSHTLSQIRNEFVARIEYVKSRELERLQMLLEREGRFSQALLTAGTPIEEALPAAYTAVRWAHSTVIRLPPFSSEQRVIQRDFLNPDDNAYRQDAPHGPRMRAGNHIFASRLNTALGLNLVRDTVLVEGSDTQTITTYRDSVGTIPDFTRSPMPVFEFILQVAASIDGEPTYLVERQSEHAAHPSVYAVNYANILQSQSTLSPAARHVVTRRRTHITTAHLNAFFSI